MQNTMQNIGVIGLGDMGSGLAKNLIKNGFDTFGFDLSAPRMAAFCDMGGTATENIKTLAQQVDAAYVMVMHGDQAKEVILGAEKQLLDVATVRHGGIIRDAIGAVQTKRCQRVQLRGE